MSDNSKIEWTDASWNPVRARLRAPSTGSGQGAKVGWHCVHMSEGCRNCYAESINRRLGTGLAYKPGHEKDVEIFLQESILLSPLRWRRPRMIFAGSMTDLFADFVTDDMLDRMFAAMALCPQHIFQLLTKRPERMRDYCSSLSTLGRNVGGYAQQIMLELESRTSGGVKTTFPTQAEPARDFAIDRIYGPLPNVWLGVSVEDQAAVDARIPDLLATPAALRFLSCEPLLGPVDLRNLRMHEERWPYVEVIDCLRGIGFEIDKNVSDPGHPSGWLLETITDLPRIDWVICGGESGSAARPMHPDWARSLRDQCAAAGPSSGSRQGIPFFFKQWGEWAPGGIYERGTDTIMDMQRVGKRRAGRLLDGVLHDAMPAEAPA